MCQGVGGSVLGVYRWVCEEVKAQIQHQLLNVDADEAAGTVINAHAVLRVRELLGTPATRSSPPVSSASLPPLSDGRRGVPRRAAEDQRHAGGDPEEDGPPVQTGQHLHHGRLAAPGRAQLRHQQVNQVHSPVHHFPVGQ